MRGALVLVLVLAWTVHAQVFTGAIGLRTGDSGVATAVFAGAAQPLVACGLCMSSARSFQVVASVCDGSGGDCRPSFSTPAAPSWTVTGAEGVLSPQGVLLASPPLFPPAPVVCSYAWATAPPGAPWSALASMEALCGLPPHGPVAPVTTSPSAASAPGVFFVAGPGAYFAPPVVNTTDLYACVATYGGRKGTVTLVSGWRAPDNSTHWNPDQQVMPARGVPLLAAWKSGSGARPGPGSMLGFSVVAVSADDVPLLALHLMLGDGATLRKYCWG